MNFDDDDEMMDNGIADFAKYEDYLDSMMNDEDLFYLEDKELAHMLYEVGMMAQGDIMTREVFQQKQDAFDLMKKQKDTKQPKALSHAGCKIDHSNFLKALADREADVRSGRMTTIIFIRQQKKGHNEISGYIDLAHRLKTDNFRDIFEGKK